MNNRTRNIILGALAAAGLVGILFVGSKLFEPVQRDGVASETSRAYSDDDDSSSSKNKKSSSSSKTSNKKSNSAAKSSTSKDDSSANQSSKDSEETATDPVDPATYGILQYMEFGVTYSPDGQGGYNLTLAVNNRSYMDANFDLSKFTIENGPTLNGAGSQVVPSLENQTIPLGNTGVGDPGRATYNLLYNGQVVAPITFQ